MDITTYMQVHGVLKKISMMPVRKENEDLPVLGTNLE